jgi:hypothetical protein
MSLGGLDDGRQALGSFDLVPISSCRIMQGDVAWLPSPPDDKAQAIRSFEPQSLTFEVTYQGALVLAERGTQLVGVRLIRSVHAQCETVGLQADALAVQDFQQSRRTHRRPLTESRRGCKGVAGLHPGWAQLRVFSRVTPTLTG